MLKSVPSGRSERNWSASSVRPSNDARGAESRPDSAITLWSQLLERHGPQRVESPYWTRGVDVYDSVTALKIFQRLYARFVKKHGHTPDLLQPRTFSEHLFLQKFFAFWPIPSVADKLYAKEYARRLCGESIVPKTVWHGTNFLDFYADPVPAGEYVLKANHGCKMVRKLRTPDDTDWLWEELTETTNAWLGADFGYADGEWQYSTFRKLVFLEELLKDDRLEHPYDYKFYCAKGVCRLIHVDVDRYTDFKCAFYTPEWRKAGVRLADYPDTDVARPDNLAEMIAIAERLSAEVPFARVDLYNLNGRSVKFGEITLTPGNGMEPFADYETDLRVGRLLFPGRD